MKGQGQTPALLLVTVAQMVEHPSRRASAVSDTHCHRRPHGMTPAELARLLRVSATKLRVSATKVWGWISRGEVGAVNVVGTAPGHRTFAEAAKAAKEDSVGGLLS
jgi:hypothetical protein